MVERKAFSTYSRVPNKRTGLLLENKGVFYWDLDWWHGPQKVQFGEITGYPWVVGLLGSVKHMATVFYTDFI